MKQAAIAALKHCFEMEDLRKLQYEMSISLVSDEEMRELNLKYREQDKPTDVLSFPAAEVATPNDIFPMGDIVISTQTAERQATENGNSLERELTFLTAHGVLHLLGLDHEVSQQDEVIMNEIQDEIMGEIFA
jgi:probable rRNA maturation factor